MALGRYMRELWSHKIGLGLTLFFALLAMTAVLYKVSLLPPAIESRSLGLSAASTQVIVDTPESILTDRRQNTYSLVSQTNRALLLGDVMASIPVREHIAERAGIDPAQLAVAGPVTPEEPRVIADTGKQPKTTDILKSPEEYRISIQANPTVPILDIATEAPSPEAAAKLADAAVGGLRDYVGDISTAARTPEKAEIVIRQLGHATGTSVNSGAKPEFALLAFLFVFLAGSAITLYAARVRRGWGSADERPRPRPTSVGSGWAR
jgi:hypothetical protein